MAKEQEWRKTEKRFIEGAYARVNFRVLEHRFGKQSNAKPKESTTQRPSKKPRHFRSVPVDWQCGDARRIEFVGDSLLVINWLRGLWEIKYECYQRRVFKLSAQWGAACNRHCIAPPRDHHDFHRHVFRELNAEADAKANLGRQCGRCSWHAASSWTSLPYLRFFFDGSCKDGECGSGFVAFGSASPGVTDADWTIIGWMCFDVSASSITAAELEAVAAAQAFAVTYLDDPAGLDMFLEHYTPWSYAVGMET